MRENSLEMMLDDVATWNKADRGARYAHRVYDILEDKKLEHAENQEEKIVESGVVYENYAVRNYQYGIVRDHENKQIHVVLRGSDELADWRTNLKFYLVRDPEGRIPGRVHAGFIGATNLVYADIEERGVLADCKGYELVVVGHSLGGVIAKLIAKIFSIEKEAYGFSKINVITYGAPAFGNRECTNGVDEGIEGININFARTYDRITHLLSRCCGLFYVDMNNRVYLGHERGNYSLEWGHNFYGYIRHLYNLVSGNITHSMGGYKDDLKFIAAQKQQEALGAEEEIGASEERKSEVSVSSSLVAEGADRRGSVFTVDEWREESPGTLVELPRSSSPSTVSALGIE